MANDASSLIQSIIGQYGLPPDLAEQAWAKYLQMGTNPNVAELLVWIREQPAYKAAYPGIDELRASGSPYGSEANYASYVQSAKEQARLYGLPPEVYDQPADFVASMKGNVSPAELTQRYQMAAAASFTMPQQVRDALAQMGVGTGGLIGYYLDPDRAIPVLDRQFKAAQVMGAGTMAGVAIDANKANDLTDRGVTFDQAQQGFSQVASLAGLTAALGQSEVATTGGLVDAVLGGDSAAQSTAQRVQKSRQAAFGTAQAGSGLGESRTT